MPTASITMSAKPSSIAWASVGSTTFVNPALSAVARRSGLVSATLTSMQPSARSARAAPRPTAPPPITNARPSAVGRAECRSASITACHDVAKGSAKAAWVKSKLSGMSIKLRSGTTIFSANAPGRGGIEMISRDAHKLLRPPRQSRQAPHVTNGLITTRRPAPAPFATTPAASWPRISGAGRRSSWPR